MSNQNKSSKLYPLKPFLRHLRKNRFSVYLIIFISTLILTQLVTIHRYNIINIYGKINDIIQNNNYIVIKILIVLLIIYVLFTMSKLIYLFGKKISKSNYWEIIFLASFTIVLSIYISIYEKTITGSWKNWLLTSILFFLSFIICLICLYLNNKIKRPEEQPIFISDDPIDDSERDELGLKEEAMEFAKKILNNSSSKPIVFGIEAPWGYGKTTFLNFCLEWLKNNDRNNDLVFYKFEPLKYQKSRDIFSEFANGLIKQINQNLFNPILVWTLKDYANTLGKICSSFALTFHNISFSLKTPEEQMNIHDKLSKILSSTNKKIIITIDDLDRLHFEDIKIIIDLVKKSFGLPNLTFILCYSTENINSFGSNLANKKVGLSQTKLSDKTTPDIQVTDNFLINGQITELPNNQKIAEYFEKIINVKKMITISKTYIKDYFTKQIGDNNHLKKEVEKIFLPENYHNYKCFLCDLRKVKRLLNVFKLHTKVQEMNYDVFDFKLDQIILLFLLYLYNSKIFNDIYSLETSGAGGAYSYELVNEKNGRIYKHSDYYKKIICESTPVEKDLITQIFGQPNETLDPEKSKEDYSYSVKFNDTAMGYFGRNLERAMEFIAKGLIPSKTSQKRFYLSKANIFITDNTLSNILEEKEFEYKNGEEPINLLFRAIFSDLNKLTPQSVEYLFEYIIKYLENYSLTDNGFRNTIIYYLVRLLDERGWTDKDGKSIDNNEVNLLKIARRIFGEKEYKDKGIIDTFCSKSRGILGFHDALSFRLSCCGNRDSSMYNLYNALGLHENINASTTGNTVDLATQQIRELSQYIFNKFKKQYIDKNINIFEQVNNLTNKDLFGNYIKYTKKFIAKTGFDLEAEKEKIKKSCLGFIIFQLSSNSRDFGIGSGFYDVFGNKDQGSIRTEMQHYLFDTCFERNPKKNGNTKNAIYFIDFLLASFQLQPFEHKYVPKKRDFYRYFDREHLADYWKSNKDPIIEIIKKQNQSKKIYTSNYYTTYEDDIADLYKELNSLLDDKLTD